MRLLIVEDEYYTRRGIVEEVDLAAMGFDEIEQADDGVNALKIARTFRPDIVLADVRMPRMDGIEMSFALRKLLPGCHLVFMSGYADKEYLKAAIELKAVSYIEKPFRTSELRDVLARAAEFCRQERERDRREAELLLRAEAGNPLLRSEAALMLVQQMPDDARVRKALEASGLSFPADCAVALLLLRPAGTSFEETPEFRESFVAAIEKEISRASLDGLAALKGASYAIVLLWAPLERQRFLGEREIGALIARVRDAMGGIAVVAGVSPVVRGLASAHAAYEAARSALDAAFFMGTGAVAFDETAGRRELLLDADAIDAFQACLDREDGPGAAAHLRARADAMRSCGSRDTFRARELSTRLLLRLVAFAERRGIDPFPEGESVRLLTEAIERAGTLDAVSSLVQRITDVTFERLAARAAEGRFVTDIKRAVHRGFSMPGLSIEDIAREIGLSPAYVCRLFKEATGETIHGYMTVYRLERAKDLLCDPRQPKMTEVAARAGFADANYFARAFRKQTGVSPSEYREKARR